MAEALIKLLPKDTVIDLSSSGGNMRIAVSMTLETVEHAETMKTALDLAIIPLLKLNESKSASEPALPAHSGPGHCTASPPADVSSGEVPLQPSI